MSALLAIMLVSPIPFIIKRTPNSTNLVLLKIMESEVFGPPPVDRMASKALMDELLKEKARIEQDIKDAEGLLDNLGVGRHGRLVDAEGFPLKDLDLYLVRSKRNQISCTID